MILRKDIQEFLLYDIDKVSGYTHRTASKEIADSILQNGFIFVESLANTTDEVSSDPICLKYWHNLRRPYGNYTVVLGISHTVFASLNEIIQDLPEDLKSDINIESLLIDEKPNFDEASEQLLLILPEQYVKGYFCSQTGQIVKNPDYNPSYLPKALENNIQFFLETI